MASRIITKKGSGAPLASDLVHGELAVDTVNKRLYTENAGGTVIEVGTSPSTIDINAGTIDGTVIGGSSAAAGTFTTVTADGAGIGVSATGGYDLTVGDFVNFPLDTANYLDFTGAGAAMVVRTGPSPTTALRITAGNDISFYEDTGTTAKFFWDASTESLTVGNASALTNTAGFSSTLGVKGFLPSITIEDTGTGTGKYTLGVTSGNLGVWDNTRSAYLLYGDSAGNVGIGTNSPASKLEVSGTGSGAWFTLDRQDSGSNIVDFTELGTRLGYVGYIANDLTLNNAIASNIIVNTSGTERARLDASGNLLVGTTDGTPYASNVKGAVFYQSGAISGSVDGLPAGYFNRKTSDGTIVDFRKDGTTVGSISVTASTTSYNTSSDQRLKENITDANDAGDKIDAIQVRQYDWKADGSHQDYGMIAQELMTVAPEAVSGDPDSDEMMGVDYSKLVPMLVKEIQSLRARVAQLEN